MKTKHFLLWLLICSLQITYAQVSGTIDNKYAGIKFTIPNGWFGQESGDALILGSNTEAGLMILIGHEYDSIEKLKKEADIGLSDDGMSLARSGDFESFGNNGIGAEFSGYLQGTPAKAFLLSLVNPYGQGLTIMAMTTTEMYSARYRELAADLAKSVKFYKPETPPIVDEWRQALKNTRLTYRYTYSSNTYDSYGGTSEKEEIHLCAAGYFKYYSNSSMSIDTGGASAFSKGNDAGEGTWEVTGDGAGGAALKLKFHNGEVYTYRLAYEEGKTFLNGKRFFRTGMDDPNGYTPDCR